MALPEGIVSLVLTEVEGSTAKWEADAGAMAALCERLDAFVARTVGRHGGHVVKPRGEGDSHFIVFAAPVAAVTCAADLSRAVGADVGAVGLRIACHVDAVELRDGDYYGPMVNRCARLRAAAHGGQILLSSAMAGATADAVADLGMALADLGLHRLRGLQGPERVFQLDRPGRASTFPSLATMGAPTNDLGLPLTSFVGRDAEADDLTAALDEHRVVAVTGAPGVGKSRLVREVLTTRAEAATVVDLATSTDLSGALPSSLAAGTVVLDDADHVVDQLAAVLPEWLAASAGATVVITSRRALPPALGGMATALRLHPLDASDAANLVRDRLPALAVAPRAGECPGNALRRDLPDGSHRQRAHRRRDGRPAVCGRVPCDHWARP